MGWPPDETIGGTEVVSSKGGTQKDKQFSSHWMLPQVFWNNHFRHVKIWFIYEIETTSYSSWKVDGVPTYWFIFGPFTKLTFGIGKPSILTLILVCPYPIDFWPHVTPLTLVEMLRSRTPQQIFAHRISRHCLLANPDSKYDFQHKKLDKHEVVVSNLPRFFSKNIWVNYIRSRLKDPDFFGSWP